MSEKSWKPFSKNNVLSFWELNSTHFLLFEIKKITSELQKEQNPLQQQPAQFF